MQLIKTTRDTLLRPLQIVSGVVERRHTMPVLANVVVRAQQCLPKGLARALKYDEISLLTVPELLVSVKTLMMVPRRLAGLRTQDEPPQQQDLNLCPNCCLRAMLGPIARAPPIATASKDANTNEKAFSLLQTSTPT